MMDSIGETNSGSQQFASSASSSERGSKMNSGPVTDRVVNERNCGDDSVLPATPHPDVTVDGLNMEHQDAAPLKGTNKPEMTKHAVRVPCANLFKNNRLANDDYKLEYVVNGHDKLNFGFEHIDSIEKTYGICLLGFVLNGHPPTAALRDLVKRWGSNVQFQTHENGWITFTFPSVELKDKVLCGGNYKVYGHHLFLKEMPRCFRFREEDLTSFPAWVQIHGLPPDCWSFHILSNIVSRIGRPVHVDMVMFNRKNKTKFARVLVDIDTSIQRIDGMTIGLPIGDVDIRFVYEIDVKTCSYCKEIGHTTEKCWRKENIGDAVGTVGSAHANQRHRSRSKVRRHGQIPRGRSRSIVNSCVQDNLPCEQHVIDTIKALKIDLPDKSPLPVVNSSRAAEVSKPPVHVDACVSSKSAALKETTPNFPIKAVNKGKNIVEFEMEVHNLGSGDYEDQEENFKIVTSKRQQKKTNKIKRKKEVEIVKNKNTGIKKFFEGMEGITWEDNGKKKECTVIDNEERKDDIPVKGRQPKVASVSQLNWPVGILEAFTSP